MDFCYRRIPAGCSLAAMAERHLGHAVDSDPAGKPMRCWRFFKRLRPEVEAGGLADVYARIDLPLDSRAGGDGIDGHHGWTRHSFAVLSGRMEVVMERAGGEIYELAGKII